MKKIYVILGVLMLLCFGLCGCNKEIEEENKNAALDAENTTDISSTNGENETSFDSTEKDRKVIIWTIPDGVTVAELQRNVELVNEKLAEDGYDFLLEIQTLSSKAYRTLLVPLLKEGKTDIASLGMDYAGGSMGYAQTLIREGYFEELSEYLFSEEGEKLRETYCELEWKIVETDGGIYSLPNQYGMKGNVYMAFNKAYVTEEMLKGFSGSIGEIENILKQVNIPEGVVPIIGCPTLSTLAAMSGKQELHGVLLDLQTGVAENPYQNEAFCYNLRKVNELYKKGYIHQLDEEERTETIENLNYVLWFGQGQGDFYEEIKEQVITIPLPFVLSNALSCTTGISNNAVNREEALQLLTLIYTEEEYMNLLLYGKEGPDYQLIDGYVCSVYGDAFRVSKKNLLLGIYDQALPCRGDDLAQNRREIKTEWYQSEYCLNSVILGLKLDYSAFDKEMYGVESVTETNYSVWKADDFESALQEAANAVETSGGNKLIEELNRQVAEWKQER